MSRRSTRAAVRTYPNAGATVSAPAGELDRTIFPSRPLVRTFYRVRQGEVLAVLFTWTKHNHGGWEAKGGLFSAAPEGGTPTGWHATKRAAIEAELVQAAKELEHARAHLAAAEAYADRLRGQLP